MSEHLLSIPLKNTTDTDLIEPFKKFFSVCNVSKNFDKELTELNTLRSQIVPKILNKSEVGVQNLARYYDQIHALERKLSPEGLVIQFTWEDALDKGTLLRGRASTTLPFLVFERQCVLFNIAALQSQLAAQFRISDSDDELKAVAKWFQQASGIFAHLSTEIAILKNQKLTVDLCSDTLESLSLLMLAQAQEIFVLKAIKDNMKDLIVAKLSAQAEDMFSEALLKMTKENIKHQWEQNWLLNAAGKRIAYEALAQYFQSKACATSKRVGEQISRLSLSLELLVKAQEKLQSQNQYSFYINEAARLVAEAKKDNDFIYHEQVPSYNNLPTIEKIASARLAKPTPVSAEQLFTPFKELFEDLKPLSDRNCENPIPAATAFSKVEQPNNVTVPIPDQVSQSPTTTHTDANSNPTESHESDPNENPSPLKLAIDASLHAVNYYMQQYLGKKSE